MLFSYSRSKRFSSYPYWGWQIIDSSLHCLSVWIPSWKHINKQHLGIETKVKILSDFSCSIIYYLCLYHHLNFPWETIEGTQRNWSLWTWKTVPFFFPCSWVIKNMDNKTDFLYILSWSLLFALLNLLIFLKGICTWKVICNWQNKGLITTGGLF